MKINKQQLLEEVTNSFNYYKKSGLNEEDIFYGIYNGLLLKYNLVKDTEEEMIFWETYCEITAMIEVLNLK
jgi:hypothetical protein